MRFLRRSMTLPITPSFKPNTYAQRIKVKILKTNKFSTKKILLSQEMHQGFDSFLRVRRIILFFAMICCRLANFPSFAAADPPSRRP